MYPLSTRLLSLTDESFHHGLPCPQERLDALERAAGDRFPDDYRAVMLEVGAFQVRGPELWIILESVSDLVLDLDEDFLTAGPMPGIVMIGSDNGDYGYYYDLKNRLGRGAFALYFVDRGTMTFAASRFVAPTLSEAVEQLLAGENFRERPPLG
jgi:hypothetical protein